MYYPCDKQGYCNRVLDFFPVNKFVRSSRGSSDKLDFLQIQKKLYYLNSN